MQTLIMRPRNKYYTYYRCVGVKNGSADTCKIKRCIPAEELETEIWDAVRLVYGNKELLEHRVRENYSERRKELSGPGLDTEELARRLETLERDWLKWQEAYRADAISVADLKARRAEIEENREGIEGALERARGRDAELEALDREEAESYTREEVADASTQEDRRREAEGA